MKVVNSIDESDIISEKYNYYVKLEPRKKLYASLQTAKKIENMKERQESCN